jgi:hypothetical protein
MEAGSFSAAPDVTKQPRLRNIPNSDVVSNDLALSGLGNLGRRRTKIACWRRASRAIRYRGQLSSVLGTKIDSRDEPNIVD